MAASTLDCTVSRAALVEALSAAVRVVDKKVIPVLGTMLLTAEGADLCWWATDGQLWRSGLVPAVQASGSGLVPAVQALSVLKSCDTEDVRVKADVRHIVVTAGKYTAKLPAQPREDFPTLPILKDAKTFSAIKASALRDLLAHVQPAILTGSMDLSGALFRVADDALLCVATDRHQLAKMSRPLDRAVLCDDATVSYRLLQELARLADGDDVIEFSLTDDRHVFRAGSDVLIGQPLHAKFPAFERVIPKDGKSRVVANRALLLAALDRVALAADDPQRNVLFAASAGALMLTAKSASRGEAEEAVAVSTTGPAVSFRLNPTYARNFLAQCAATDVECELWDDGRPVVFRATTAPDDVYVIMPVRI